MKEITGLVHSFQMPTPLELPNVCHNYVRCQQLYEEKIKLGEVQSMNFTFVLLQKWLTAEGHFDIYSWKIKQINLTRTVDLNIF